MDIMNYCLINIGNTNTEICNESLGAYVNLSTKSFIDEFYEVLEPYKKCFVASVVPKVSNLLKSGFKKKIYPISAELIKDVDFSKVDASTLGADRVANALAAKSLYGSNVLIIDCGTCVTTELIVNNVFSGGFIMPGRQLQRNALHDHTGQLPIVKFSEESLLLGTNTKESIQVGVDTLSSKAVLSWIEEMRNLHDNLKIVFTGGDKEFFSRYAKFEFVLHDKFTLQGLKAFAELQLS